MLMRKEEAGWGWQYGNQLLRRMAARSQSRANSVTAAARGRSWSPTVILRNLGLCVLVLLAVEMSRANPAWAQSEYDFMKQSSKLHAEGRPDAAVAAATRGLQMYPKSFELFFRRGQSYRDLL